MFCRSDWDTTTCGVTRFCLKYVVVVQETHTWCVLQESAQHALGNVEYKFILVKRLEMKYDWCRMTQREHKLINLFENQL